MFLFCVFCVFLGFSVFGVGLSRIFTLLEEFIEYMFVDSEVVGDVNAFCVFFMIIWIKNARFLDVYGMVGLMQS